MTLEEMNKVIQTECGDGWYDCKDCAIKHQCDQCDGLFMNHPEICEEAYNIIMERNKVNAVDMIERPPHYNREGAMESIDEMELIFGKEAVKHFCLCNIWKYRYRASDKNGKEDLEKSDWYMRKYRELCSNE